MDTNKPKRTWIEIDPIALITNVKYARRVAKGAAVMAVVKADAYGHGFAGTIETLSSEVDAFGVATLKEAQTLLSNTEIKPTVMILGALLPDERKPALATGLHVTVSSLNEAKTYSCLANRMGISAYIHLIIDTGMGRIGFSINKFISEAPKISSLPNLKIEGIATHFPCSNVDQEFTRKQIHDFTSIIKNSELKPRWIHLANSAGVLDFGTAGGNMIRPGLMLYGVSPFNENEHQLKPAMEWKARITQVRELPTGMGISYDQTFITTEPTIVATVAVGYGDGYPISISGNNAEVCILDQRCPVLGKVTMDMIMVDVSTLHPAPCPGDEVTLIGGQTDTPITATELAKKANTIPWEILTGISPRVDRIMCIGKDQLKSAIA